jgi:hypothetical protein
MQAKYAGCIASPAYSSQLSRRAQAAHMLETSRPAHHPPTRSRRHTMTTTPTTSLTRAERLGLAAAALRGVLAGTARAVTTWLLDQQIHH